MVDIPPYGHLYAFGESLEYALYLVVLIGALGLDVEVHLRCVAYALEEVHEHLGGMSPIFSRLNSVSHISHGRPPKSSATLQMQSSMGRQNP